jgi:sugar phosphate isomerase/epimerase
VHPRLTVFDRVFGGATVEDVISGLGCAVAPRAGIARARLERDGVRESAAAIAAAGLDVTHLLHGPLFELERASTWEAARADAIETLELATSLGARCVYGLTGPAYGLTWEAAAEAFAAAAAPVAEHARATGVPFLLEPANMLFAKLGFLHTLRDTVEVARDSGLAVCLDVQHCWTERGLRETIRQASGLVGLVQLSDLLPDRREPYRAVPGDGVIPLERIVAAVLEDGYTGYFDLELYGEEGVEPVETIKRSADYVGALLERLGA